MFATGIGFMEMARVISQAKLDKILTGMELAINISIDRNFAFA